MAQPSGQLSLKTANASEFFYYAQGTNGLWDARNGALLSKTGTAGMATEGGAQVVLGDAATQYNLPSAINITGGAWTVIFKARISSGADINSMTAGDATGTVDFFWLSNSSGNCAIRVNNANYSFANSDNTTLATYAWVYAGTQLKLYKNGSLLNTFTGVQSGSALKISAILAGYSGGSFRLNGALEFLNAIPSALSDAEIASRTSDPYAVLEVGASSTPTTISATLANITGSVASKSNPKTTISATLANVSASIGSTVGTLTTTITATLGNIVGSINSTGSTANGTFTSEVLKDYAGNVLANTALNFVRFYNDTTGALVLNKTGVSTNGSGIVTFSDAALVAGTTYRVDWETSAGSRRMPRKAAA